MNLNNINAIKSIIETNIDPHYIDNVSQELTDADKNGMDSLYIEFPNISELNRKVSYRLSMNLPFLIKRYFEKKGYEVKLKGNGAELQWT